MKGSILCLPCGTLGPEAAHAQYLCTTSVSGRGGMTAPQTHRRVTQSRGELHSPLYLRQELRLKDAPGLQRLRDLSPEEEAPFGQINQNLPDDLSEVHAAAHLLISDM